VYLRFPDALSMSAVFRLARLSSSLTNYIYIDLLAQLFFSLLYRHSFAHHEISALSFFSFFADDTLFDHFF